MEIIADLHLHGRYSRATSKHLSIDNLEKYARIKGVDLLGTGDFTHPEWIKEHGGFHMARGYAKNWKGIKIVENKYAMH